MRRNPTATKGREVELLNVPLYEQGTFDGLCAYYTGAMMLATLFPQFAVEFGMMKTKTSAKHMSRDPLIMEHGGDDDDRKVLAKWYYLGENIKKVVGILNTNMERRDTATRFEYKDRDRKDGTLNDIVDDIDQGLPVMLGWNTPDNGCHAVLVSGYWFGKEKWLTVNDPGGNTEFSWDSLKAQQKRRGKFEVGRCIRHFGPRPMKSVTDGKTSTVYQWTPEQTYVSVENLFGGAG